MKTGDFRTDLGAEDPRKISNIVINQMRQFEEIYLKRLKDSYSHHVSLHGTTISQDTSSLAKEILLAQLPQPFRARFLHNLGKSLNNSNYSASQAFAFRLLPSTVTLSSTNNITGDLHSLQSAMAKTLRQICYLSSITQAMKGFLTAGITTSVTYALRKLRKALF